MTAYTNGTTLARKVRVEATGLGQCLREMYVLSSRSTTGSDSANEVRAWQECVTRACNWIECILGAGLYAPQVLHWLQHFPPERFLLLEEGQLRSQPGWVAHQLSAFLQLPKRLSAEGVLAVVSNHTHSSVVGEALRRTLRSFYDEQAPQVRRLFERLAPTGSEWAAARWLSARHGEASSE